MGDPTETVSYSETVDLDRVRSRISELRDIHGSPNDIPELPPSDSKKFLKDSALQLESKINEVLSEFSDIGSLAVEDLDAYVGHMKEELNSVEAANAKISKEIEDLTRTYIGDSSQLESELEGLSRSLDFITMQGVEKAKANGHVDCSSHGEEVELLNARGDYKFKVSIFVLMNAICFHEDGLTQETWAVLPLHHSLGQL